MNYNIASISNRLPAIAALSALLTGPIAHAAESWGTQAEAFTLTCISADCSGGGTTSGGSTFEPSAVSYQSTSATNSVSDVRGEGTLTATLETQSPGPATMRQFGASTAGPTGIVRTEGHTLDFVTYNGPPTTITINVDLTGEHTGPTSGVDNTQDGIRGIVYVFRQQSSIDFLDSEQSPRPSCLFECYSPDDSAEVEISDSNLPDSDALTLSLEDGDTFYLYSRLSMATAGGGTATSLNSFTYTFSSTAGLTSLAAGGAVPVDTDGDGVVDTQDNCTLVANPAQIDANGDGYGNFCDADLDDNLSINVVDLGLLRVAFFSADPVADLNSDGVVNVSDLGIMRTSFLQSPGPSGIAP